MYGWYVLGASFLILFFNAGARFAFGVMFKPMIAEFGWSRGAMSFAFFLNMAVYALSLMVVGKFYDRYGPKWVIVISTVFLTIGYGLTSMVTSLWQFFLGYGLLAAIGLGGTSVPLIATLMSKWFNRWRGLAISLALCGNSVGQFVLIPLITAFIMQHGWRAAYLYIGWMMFVVNMALAFLVLRGDPDHLGHTPVGYHNQPELHASMAPAADQSRDLSLREAMHTPSFWLFLLVMFICGSGDFLVATHLIPLVTDYGISSTTGGHMLAWYGLMSLGGVLVAGPASDVIGNKLPMALTFVLRGGIFLLVLRYQTLTSFYIFALAFGFTHLITAPLTPTLLGKLYGFSHLGLLAGCITTVHHLAGGIGAYGGGVLFDWTASYRLAFLLEAMMALVAFGCSMLIVERKHRVPH